VALKWLLQWNAMERALAVLMLQMRLQLDRVKADASIPDQMMTSYRYSMGIADKQGGGWRGGNWEKGICVW
jgi:hypothetical protein